MTEVLITLRTLNESHPVTVGEFRWHEGTKRHLMQGRPLSVEEFNAFTHSPEWDRSIERNGERLRIELREVIAQSQDGQVAKSSGSYPGDAGATPAPATISDLMSAAATAAPPPGRRKRENTRANRGRRAKHG